MDMQRVSSGKLRAIGYDAASRRLRVQFDDGVTLEYEGIGSELWRRLSTGSSAWSVYRDNIEEEFTGTRVTNTEFSSPGKKNPLDDLFS